MTDGFTLRPLHPDQAQAAAALLRASFEPELHPYIAYCQEQAAEYLATVARFPVAFGDRALYVVTSSEGGLAGFAEFRAVADSTDLLSYICIDAAARGRRLAARLLEHHVERRPHLREMMLDVFAHNAPARALYSRLGFEGGTTTSWWSRPLPEARTERLRVDEWHASLASLRTYGFCMAGIDRDGTPLRLALPSARVVRVPDVATFSDDGLLAALRGLLPSLENALVFVPPGTPPPTAGGRVLDSLRLLAPVPFRRVPS